MNTFSGIGGGIHQEFGSEKQLVLPLVSLSNVSFSTNIVFSSVLTEKDKMITVFPRIVSAENIPSIN